MGHLFARNRIIAAVGLTSLLLATGCGGDDDGGSDPLLDTFEVTRHTLSEDGCEAPMPVEDAANCFDCVVTTPFFRAERQSFFGQSIVVTTPCSAADMCESDEDDTIDLGGGLFERKVDGAWVGSAYAAGSGGVDCSYIQTDFRLAPGDEGGVRLTRTEMRLKDDAPSKSLTGDDCLDLTDNPPPADELECAKLEEVLGTPVP